MHSWQGVGAPAARQQPRRQGRYARSQQHFVFEAGFIANAGRKSGSLSTGTVRLSKLRGHPHSPRRQLQAAARQHVQLNIPLNGS